MAGNKYRFAIHDGPEAPELMSFWERDSRDFFMTPFQRRQVLTAFYRHLPKNCSGLIVSVSEIGSGRVAMLLPLLMREAYTMRLIEGADLGLSDYVAPAVADWFRPTASEMNTLWKALLRFLPPADLLSLKKMPNSIRNRHQNPLALLPGTESMGITTKTLDLRSLDCATHYRRSGLYKDGMRQLRRLQRHGEVEFRIAQTPRDGLAQFEHLLEQRRIRFSALKRPDALSRPEVRQFYRELIEDGVERGEVLFGGLYFDGECVATDLGIVHGGIHHGIFTSMKAGEEFARYSLGTIAFMLILDQTLERGIRHYDIGVGEFAYKDRLPGTTTPLLERHEALSLRGHIALANANFRRLVRKGLSRYPALRGPAKTLAQRFRPSQKLSVAASVGLIVWSTWLGVMHLAD
jgi:CelD/BcsL family acetyltransferase involved in cellulose biosynthesis